VSVASANEMEVHLKTALELEYAGEPECRRLIEEYEIIGKQLTKLIQYWRSRGDDQ
jgi:four helix bundle protein